MSGRKIIDGLKAAVAGEFSRVTIEGQTWVRRTTDRPAQDAPPYNDGYTHEALHTTHVLMEAFADHVLDSRTADQFPDIKAQAERAHQAMFDLYQIIGTKFED